jgi:hypothetical protein
MPVMPPNGRRLPLAVADDLAGVSQMRSGQHKRNCRIAAKMLELVLLK